MLHKLRDRAASEKGFTLIELLVVILIIGILAAIALPAFLNQRSKAQDTEAKSAARTAQTAMETWYTDEQTYVGATEGRHWRALGQDRARPERAASRRPAWRSRVRPPIAYKDHGHADEDRHVFTITKATDRQRLRARATAPARAARVSGGCPASGKW